MKTYQAILSKTTKDDVKSKIKSTEYVELVLDVYMCPQDYARFMEQYFEESFEIGLPMEDVSPVPTPNHPVELITEGQE